jgi:hypothetical protein
MRDYSKARIYKVINSVNEKVYIGSTIKPTRKKFIDMKYHLAHGQWSASWHTMAQDMLKIGFDKFTIKRIKRFPCLNARELATEEYRMVQKYLQRDRPIYNDLLDGKRLSAETCKRMSESRKGSKNARFKRGCVCRVHTRKRGTWWAFAYRENSKDCRKTFSIRKYGNRLAYQMAIIAQNEKYPRNS